MKSYKLQTKQAVNAHQNNYLDSITTYNIATYEEVLHVAQSKNDFALLPDYWWKNLTDNILEAVHVIYYKKVKNIKNVRRCRDGMPKSMQTR